MAEQVKSQFSMLNAELTLELFKCFNNSPKSKGIQIFLWILLKANYGYMNVYFTHEDVMKGVGCNKLTAAHWIKQLLKCYILIKRGSGKYWINPHCSFCGEKESKHAARAKWDEEYAKLLEKVLREEEA